MKLKDIDFRKLCNVVLRDNEVKQEFISEHEFSEDKEYWYNALEKMLTLDRLFEIFDENSLYYEVSNTGESCKVLTNLYYPINSVNSDIDYSTRGNILREALISSLYKIFFWDDLTKGFCKCEGRGMPDELEENGVTYHGLKCFRCGCFVKFYEER